MQSTLITVLAFLFAGRCALPQTTDSIQGKVSDATGASIFGAVVTVQATDGNSHLTVTDAAGGRSNGRDASGGKRHRTTARQSG